MKTAKVFKSGNSQAVRLPKEFRLDCDQVYISKIDNKIILVPVQKSPLDILFEGLAEFSDDFMSDRQQPDEQTREEL